MAADNVKSIVAWFDKFPEFKKNHLYISGESYGGMYVPFTVNAIPLLSCRILSYMISLLCLILCWVEELFGRNRQSCVFSWERKSKDLVCWNKFTETCVLICHENCVMAVIIVRISLSHCTSHRPQTIHPGYITRYHISLSLLLFIRLYLQVPKVLSRIYH